jgi:structural maintenance of chromosome 4
MAPRTATDDLPRKRKRANTPPEADMAPASSPRKSTRMAVRRKAPVLEDSDEEEENQAPKVEPDSEEDLMPAPAPTKPARRGRPRKTADTETPKPKPKPTTRRRTTRAATEDTPDVTEPPQLFPPEGALAESPLIAKKSTKKRAPGRPAKKKARVSEVASIAEDEPQLPTPQSSTSPDSEAEGESANTIVPGTPLADITASAINEGSSVLETQEAEEPAVPKDEEPVSNDEETAISNDEEPAIPNNKDSILEPQQAHVEPVIAKEEAVVPESGQAIVEPQQLKAEPLSSQHTVMERPMDIVVRKRAAGIPLTQEPAVPKARTVITYLVLTNFKSYAGRQEVGPFHSSFSSVVGPNGSGKSNVIDSLLFVFGFRASKMRQGKISALIHNSAAFPDLNHCEVEVHFQEVMDLPNGAHEVMPNSQLVISRRAFKNNASKYYINNKESTFTIVTTLLRDRGVDLDHKRFLILQGEVESIAQMKPKAASEHDDGLLEYLEDIIGTSKYKTPIEESAAETETLNEVCMEKSNRVQHVEKEKSGLEDKKNKALAYIRDENELSTKQAALFQIYMSNFDDHIEVTQESVAQMDAQLKEEQEKHKGNEEGIKQLEKQYKKGGDDFKRLEKQTQDVLKDVAQIDKETVKFEEKKKFLTGKQKKLEKTRETSKFGISSADTQAKQYAADIERYVEEIAELENNMKIEEKELETVRVSLAGKTQGLSDEIAAKQKSLEPWSEKVNEKQSAIAVAQSELDILREKENSGAKSIAEIEAKIANFKESKEAKTTELEECKAEKKKIEQDVRKIQTEIDELAQKEPTIRTKLSGARQKADEARASLSATQTQGNVLTGLMRLKDSGRINGFHGRLGNLGAIDQKYDVAISTACPQLDNLVVDSVEVGQQCIDYLRKNNLGRANFILLDRLAQRDLSQIDTPESVPRLFDLVKPKNDKFQPAFYSVLQNTLVAKDLVQANRIAYGAKRWRVVTLDGQLIDKSGTMSGGGTRVAKGGMSSRLASDVTKDQVVKLEHDRDSLESNFTELQQAQRQLETTLRDLEGQIPQLETKAQKIALELDSFDRNIADSQRRIKELSAEKSTSKIDKVRISALEKNVTALEKEVSKLHAETAGVEDEIKALQDKIMQIGGVKLRSQKAVVDGLKQQIDTLTDAVSNAEVSRSKEEKQRAKHEKAHNDATKELEKLALDAEDVEEKMQAQKKDAAGIRQQAEEAQEVCKVTTYNRH